MAEILFQLKVFILTMGLGIVAGLIFHYYQMILRQAQLKKIIVYFLDFTIWIIMLALVFMVMLWINAGEIRVYVLIALMTGVAVYYYFGIKLTAGSIGRAVLVTVQLVRIIKIAFVKPLLWLISWIKSGFIRKNKPPPDAI